MPGSYRPVRARGSAQRQATLAVALVLTLLLALFAGPAQPSSAATQTFSNLTPITINDTPAPPTKAAAYPSTIDVAGVAGTIIKVTPRLNGLSHFFPDDVAVLLVSPTGKKIRLMSDVGGAAIASNVTLTFDAAAPALPEASLITTGTYRPTAGSSADGGSNFVPIAFPAPAPANPYTLSLASLNGDSPNGTWSLYVIDDTSGDNGSLSSGWSLTITTNAAPTAFDDSTTTVQNTPVTIDVLANDTDPDSNVDPTTVGVVATPTQGSTSIDAATGQITYTPTTGYTGPDSFTYTVSDTLGAVSNPATVSITVTLPSTSTPTVTPTLTPTVTLTVTLTATLTPTSTSTSTPTATLTSTSTVTPGACGPRPTVGVNVVPAGSGRLQVTVSPSTAPSTPGNHLYVLRATIPPNARVDVVSGPGDLVGQQDLPVGTGTQPVVFFVRRAGPGAITVPLIAVDSCGSWPSFVGGGSDAF